MSFVFKIKYFLFFLLLVLIMGVPFSVYSFKKANEDIILFNIVFLGENIKGNTREQVKELYLKKIGSYSLTVIENGLSKEYNLEDFGFNIDYAQIESDLFLFNEINLSNIIKNSNFYYRQKKINYDILLTTDNLLIENDDKVFKNLEGKKFYFHSNLPDRINKERFIYFLLNDLDNLGITFKDWNGGSSEFRELQKIMDKNIEIILGTKTVILDEADKVRFLDINDNSVLINEKKLNTFFEEYLLPQLNIPSKDRIVRVENKIREIEVYGGEKGFVANVDYLREKLFRAIRSGENKVVAMGEEVAPQTRYEYIIVPDWSKKVVISLSTQTLVAYEGDQEVFRDFISSGRPNTPTPLGTYYVYGKTRTQSMRGPGYYLPNVWWIVWFYGEYAIHGAYWHNNFGTPMSRGCVNMTNDSAKFIFDWIEIGNPVLIVY